MMSSWVVSFLLSSSRGEVDSSPIGVIPNSPEDMLSSRAHRTSKASVASWFIVFFVCIFVFVSKY